MRDYGTKCFTSRTIKDCGRNNVRGIKINRQQKNNSIVSNTVDKIPLTENQKRSAATEAPECSDSDYNENDLYQFDKLSIEETK